MANCAFKVTDFISEVPMTVERECRLDTIFSKMLKQKTNENSSLNTQNDFIALLTRKRIFKHTNQFERLHLSDILEGENAGIVAYPESDIQEVYSIMKNLGIKCVPIVKNPWNKRLMGFLNIQCLDKALN